VSSAGEMVSCVQAARAHRKILGVPPDKMVHCYAPNSRVERVDIIGNTNEKTGRVKSARALHGLSKLPSE
jgi:hypothetical protein